jgi:hypothetical protein
MFTIMTSVVGAALGLLIVYGTAEIIFAAILCAVGSIFCLYGLDKNREINAWTLLPGAVFIATGSYVPLGVHDPLMPEKFDTNTPCTPTQNGATLVVVVTNQVPSTDS